MKFIDAISILITALLFSGCEKVIDIDLNSSNPEIVIEGNVTNQPGPYTVKISKTINWNQPNVFPSVSGAVVQISDNLGNSETLIEGPSGIYKSNTLNGVPGRSYTLKVQSEGNDYQATSTMPAAVSIDTVIVDSITFGKNSNKFLKVKFTDPVGIENFYRIVEIINGDTLGIINIENDKLRDGDQITMSIFSDEDPELLSGDQVEVILQCIDKNIYNYFRELMDVKNAGNSASPANPTSNINNNSLGYFSAQAVDSKILIVP